MNEIIKELANIRINSGYSQRYIGNLMGSSQSQVGKMETLRAEPRWETLSRYAATLGYEVVVSLRKKRQ